MSTPEEQLREQLHKGYPESWRWDEDGPEVIGYAKRKERGRTQFGETDILILDVKNAEGKYEERSIWLMHTTLVSKLQRVRPGAGDLIGILQLGEREPKGGGASYMDYNVVISKKEGAALGWEEQSALPAATTVAEGQVVESRGDPVSSDWEPPAQEPPPDDYNW